MFKPIGLDLSFLRFGGFLGVEIFFVLSGFLIGNIVIKIFFNKQFKVADLKSFWIRRWFRTLPNYYFILLMNILLGIFLFDLSGFNWKYIFFLQNAYTPHPYFFEEAWSLSIEELFYLSFPILLFFLQFVLSEKRKVIFLTILFFLIIIPLLRYGLYLFKNPEWSYGFRKISIIRLDSIVYGVLVALVNKYYKNNLIKYKNKLFIIGLSLIIICVYILLKFILSTAEATMFHKTIYFCIVNFSIALTIPFFTYHDFRWSNYSKRIITNISLTSYSIYLIHYSIVMNLFKKFWVASSLLEAVLELACYCMTVFTLAHVIYTYFEIPLTKVRDKFS